MPRPLIVNGHLIMDDEIARGWALTRVPICRLTACIRARSKAGKVTANKSEFSSVNYSFSAEIEGFLHTIIAMKRGRDGAPTMIVHRWNRLPLSCRACREKKRRCDRKQPCANCSLRNLPCDYTDNTGDGHPIMEREDRIPAPPGATEQTNSRSPVVSASPDQPAPYATLAAHSCFRC